MVILIKMLSRMGPGNHVLDGVQMPHRKRHFGVSGGFKSIVKHRILGLGKMVSCTKTGRPILTVYSSSSLLYPCGHGIKLLIDKT